VSREQARKPLALAVALRVVATLALLVLFLIATVVAVVLHLDVAPARRLIARVVSAQASAALKGSVELRAIEHLGPRGLALGPAIVRDPEGAQVLAIDEVRVDYHLVALLKALLRDGDTATIDRVRVRGVHVALRDDAHGSPTLAHAFEARHPKPEEPSAPSKLRLAVRGIQIDGLDAGGTLAGTRYAIEGSVEDAEALIEPAAIHARVGRLRLISAPIAGVVQTGATLTTSFALALPGRPSPDRLPIRLHDLVARVHTGATDLLAEGSFDGARFTGRLEGRTRDGLASTLGGAPSTLAEAEVDADVAGSLHGVTLDARVRAEDALQARLIGALDLDALGAKRHAAGAEQPIGEARLEVLDARARAFAPGAPPVVARTTLALRAVADETGLALALDGEAEVRRERRATQLGGPPTAPTLAPATMPIGGGPATQAGGLGEIEDPFRPRPKLDDVARLALRARVHRTFAGALDGGGHFALTAAGGRADVDVRIAPGATPIGLAEVRASAHLPALSALPTRLPVRGALDLDATATLDLGRKTLTARALLGARELITDAGRVPSLALEARAEGPWSGPRVDARLAVPEVQLAGDARGPGEALRDVTVHAQGTPADLRVSAQLATSRAQRLSLDATVAKAGDATEIRDLSAKLARGPFRAELSLASLAARGEAVTVRGLRLASTAGGLRLEAAIDRAHHRYDVELASTPIDLAQLADGLAIERSGARGFLTISAQAKSLPGDARVDRPLDPADDRGTLRPTLDRPRTPSAQLRRPANDPRLTGRLRLELKNAWAPPLGALEARAYLALDDRLLEGGARFVLKEIGRAEVRLGGAIAGRADDPAALRAAIGHLDLSIPDLDLARVSSFLAARPGGETAPRLGGHASFDARLARDAAEAPPEASVRLDTKGLAIARGTTVVTGVDVTASASLVRVRGAASGGARVQLGTELRAHDRRGPIVTATADVSAAWTELTAIAQGGAVDRRAWLDHPLRAAIVLPRRKVHELPPVLRDAAPLDGTLAASLRLEGTPRAPQLRLDATLADVRAPDGRRTFDARATYDGKLARAHLSLAPQRGRGWEGAKAAAGAGGAAGGTGAAGAAGEELVADAEVALDAGALLEARGGEPTWTAKLDAKLAKLPLAMFPAARVANASGFASGELHLADLHDPRAGAPTLRGALSLEGLKVGSDAFEKAALELHADRAGAGAKLSLQGPAGQAELTADAPLIWSRALVPALAPGRAATLQAKASKLRLKPLEPLVTPLDELDGRLDLDLRAALTARGDGAPPDVDAKGSLRLEDGTLVVDAIGDRWRHVAVDLALDAKQVELRKLHLEGSHGKADAKGTLALSALRPGAVHLQLDADRLPFSTGGVPRGDLSSKVLVDGDLSDPKLGKLDVKISPMTVDLAPSSDKNPQELADDPSIVVLQPIHAREPIEVAKSSTTLQIAVHLPENVWVRRNDLNLALRGDPTITVSGVTKFAGELSVERGWVQALGKRFTVDHAKVRFDGTPDLNPTLDVAVKWDAPDGSKVTIAISGRLDTPKVELSADPPGSQAEIMSLLALGRRDAGSSTNQAQAEQGAAAQTAAIVQGFTGALIGQQLQKALPAQMSLNVQGGQNLGDARISGGYQLKNLYFEVGYQAGNQQQGPTPSQSQPRTTFGVEWRFVRTWSLVTTLGDTGSAAVDLVWQFRY
jgi:hypothetical protein